MNNFCILLTTCINVKNSKNDFIFNKNGKITSISEERIKLYEKVIKFYLENTDFEIYCVESSGNFFNIEHERFNFISCDINNINSSSQGEIKSILYAYEYFKKEWKRKNMKYIVKITGKYILTELSHWVDKKEVKTCNYDIWTQDIYHEKQNNTEIFICKICLLKKILKNYNNELFEEFMYKTINSNKYICAKLPKFKNVLKSVRADGNILEYL